MERIPSTQPSTNYLERSSSLSGVDLSHMYQVFKPRKGLKKCDDNKDTYKLPHRLIEKKRRDRINECIAQLKELLPEHLKLTTLGHLEKAVVLELTLKHLQSLSSLIEQQQQQIISLQRGSPSEAKKNSGEDMFRSGFQLCAEEALRFLKDGERCELVSHLHRVASDISQSPERTLPFPVDSAPKENATNCVPVIQRAGPVSAGEQSGTDTDTDSGYGETEKGEGIREQTGARKKRVSSSSNMDMMIKQEPEEPPRKRPRMEGTEVETQLGISDFNSTGSYHTSPPPPFCLPFYLIPPSASAYLPMLEKYWYPSSIPLMYPMLSQSGPSVSPQDSSLLMQVLKQASTPNMDGKD
ncbi:class E basic helix-loop-helix protein 40 [Bombina bombina]|uniref:class E basic helix-loop-helix protein 40 n=1 Tax=Bombina bombina TaxID=8345 RepID=UPI00235A5F2D|nr:class E basic helix-loop-helix protein 40 [Bombina bombina]